MTDTTKVASLHMRDLDEILVDFLVELKHSIASLDQKVSAVLAASANDAPTQAIIDALTKQLHDSNAKLAASVTAGTPTN